MQRIRAVNGRVGGFLHGIGETPTPCIYSLCLDGFGSRKIAKYLEQSEIKTVTGKDKWSTSTIDRILSNEKYTGCLITQKSYTKDFLSGRQVKNNGNVELRRFENHYGAIIDRDVFEKVQQRRGR